MVYMTQHSITTRRVARSFDGFLADGAGLLDAAALAVVDVTEQAYGHGHSAEAIARLQDEAVRIVAQIIARALQPHPLAA